MKFPALALALLAIISTAAVTTAYQFISPYRVNIAPGDSPYLLDFWNLETDPQGNTFRWSRANSEIVFHNAGQILPPGRVITLELRLASARPSGVDPPEVRLNLIGGEGQDLGISRVPSETSTLRFALDSTHMGSGDWILKITSETFQPPGDARALGVMVRRATLRAQDTHLPLWPPFPSALYAILVPLLLFLIVREALSHTRVRRISSPLSLVIALVAVLAITVGIALRREQATLYMPFLFLLCLLLGGLALSRVIQDKELPTVFRGGILYRAFWPAGFAALVIGEAFIWLTDETKMGAILLVIGTSLSFFSMFLGPPEQADGKGTTPERLEWLLLAVIALLALALRLYRLDQVLFGLFRDETRMGLLALRVLSDPNYRPIYEGPPISQSGLLVYLIAFSFKVLGPSISALRLVGAIAGALTVPLVWRLTRDWFPNISLTFQGHELTDPHSLRNGSWSRFVPLIAAFGLAVGTMHVYYSRFTLPYVESPLLSVAAYIFLARGLKDGRWSNYALAGCFFGATQYASQVSRVSILVGAFLVLEEILKRRASPPNFARGVFALCVAAVLVLAPLLTFIAQHPNAFFARTEQVFLFNETTSSGEYPMTLLWNNIVAYGGMFNVVGDSHGGHVVPTRPEFDPVFAVLFVIGFLYALTHLRESGNRRVLFWLCAALLPGLLSIEAPAPLRVLEVPLPTFILAALGAVWLFRNGVEVSHVGILSRKRGVAFVLIILAGVALSINARVYFGELGNDPRLWEKNQALSTPLGAALSQWHQQNLIPPQTIVYVPDWLLNARDDRDVLNFTTDYQLKFTLLSKAPATLPTPALIVRPNIVGYWKTITARGNGSPNVMARWKAEDAQTQAQIRSLAGTRGVSEIKGPIFPDSDEVTFWLYVVE